MENNKKREKEIQDYFNHLNHFNTSEIHYLKTEILLKLINDEYEFTSERDRINFINNLGLCPENFGIHSFVKKCLYNDSCINCWKQFI